MSKKEIENINKEIDTFLKHLNTTSYHDNIKVLNSIEEQLQPYSHINDNNINNKQSIEKYSKKIATIENNMKDIYYNIKN